MPNVIIFDFGGVLGADANSWTKDQEVFLKTGLKKHEIDEIFHSYWPDLRIGKVDLEIVFKEIIEESKNAITISELREIYHRKISINDDVLDIAKILKQTCSIYILANESLEGMSYKIQKFQLNKYFLTVFNSAELGLYKPDPKIYEKVLLETNSPPPKVTFIDDQEVNITAAKNLGINTILFKNAQRLKEDLSEFL